jgi:hypothetical protein
MSETNAVVVQEDGSWVLRVSKANGKVQEYRCPSEDRARQLAALLEGSATASRPG